MNPRTVIGCVCSAFALFVGAQVVSASPPPGVNWAIKAGDTGSDHGNAISALPDGSSIVTGYFEGTATFGSTTLTSASGSGMFTAKANVDGTWAWAATADGASVSAGGVSTLPDGSSIVTGTFNGTATFGSTVLTSSGGSLDVFTAKMNADGSWAWATKGGGTETDIGTTISALPDGSSIVTGTFFETAVFGNTTLTSSNWSQDVFTAKMNADGTWAWATKAGGTDQDYGQSVSSFADGSSVVTGTFSGTTAFGSITLAGSTCGSAPTTYSCSSVFIAKMNADGTWAWATEAVGAADGWGQGISALPDGSSVATGYFNGTATFGSTTVTSGGRSDVFIAKMKADGTWDWATKAGGTGYDQGQGISALPDGSSIVTGAFSDTATFGSTTLTSAGGNDVFTAKMNADGTWAWATKAGGVWDDIGYEISALPNGSYVLTGSFSDTAVFGSTTLTSAGGTCFGMESDVPCTDVFVARYVYVPQAPAAPTAVAGDASASVTLTPLAAGSATSYTVTSSPGEKTCTVLAPLASCTFQGLTNGTSYRFAATATNGAGTGPASEWSVAVTPAATAVAAAVVIKGRVRCVATTCVTTGSVPAGATRITQRATSRPAGHSAAGTCTVRRVRSKRTYSCTMRLSRGAWVITTTARRQSSAMAHFSERVQVAPRKAAVTG